MHHRPTIIAGCVTGLLALALLAWLGIQADHNPMSGHLAVLAVVDIMLAVTAAGLLVHGVARAWGYAAGVRETVEQVYAEGYVDGFDRRAAS